VPDDFAISDSMREWATTKAPGVDVELHTDAFLDHFRAAPGSKGLKLDWVATWRNWMRTELQRLPLRSNVYPLRPARSTTDERVAGWLNLPDPTAPTWELTS